MHTLSAALIFSLPIVVVFAGQSSHGSHYYHARHAARSAYVRATNTTYKLTDLHQGANFFEYVVPAYASVYPGELTD